MSMKKVCDRCNKVMEAEERSSYIELVEHTDDGNEISGYDLCPECVKQFNMFIDGGTVEEDRYKDSKPCAVVIHKLADGHYGIENVPDKED